MLLKNSSGPLPHHIAQASQAGDRAFEQRYAEMKADPQKYGFAANVSHSDAKARDLIYGEGGLAQQLVSVTGEQQMIALLTNSRKALLLEQDKFAGKLARVYLSAFKQTLKAVDPQFDLADDIARETALYEVAKDLGSTEAELRALRRRLRNTRSRGGPKPA
jgi:hypothetical protein